MKKKYIIALDQGTTSSRAILFDHDGKIVEVVQEEFTQYYPKPGWVEHDPEEIWSSQLKVLMTVMKNVNEEDVAGIGITNQRETTLVWDRKTGDPIYNAIVWQDRRTAKFCDKLKASGLEKKIKNKTGLVVDAYFSATKIHWILNNVNGAQAKAEKGELAFGTVDSWLIWKLTKGKVHVTDVTNASRTMLYNIKNLKWDDSLLKIFNIPRSMLADVKESSEIYGGVDESLIQGSIPIAGIAGDQQAALFGQMCTSKGMAKSTYGTGCFLILNTGKKIVKSKNNLLSTIAWKINGKTTYALEGSVFIAGAAVQWLRDGLGLMENAWESEELAASVEDNGGVYFVPALTGLGAPYWDQYARGAILGITRGTNKAHIARAAIEGICFQVADVVRAMNADTQVDIKILKVDGGAVANNLLLQIQANLLGCQVVRPTVLETTALGAAYLAGLATGFWSGIPEIKAQWKEDITFEANIKKRKKKQMLSQWKKAVKRSQHWTKK